MIWPNTIIDNGNRANGAIGSPWVNQFNFGSNGLAIEANEFKGDTGLYGEMVYADANYLSLEQAAFVTWSSGSWGSSADFGCVVCGDGSSSATSKGYRLAIFPGTSEWKLQRVTDGSTVTQVAITTQSVAVGNKIRLTKEGLSAPFTLRAWLDTGSGWSEVLNGTDSGITSDGYPGMYLYRGGGAATAFLDDFGGGIGIGDSRPTRAAYLRFPKYKLSRG